jgi:hypothetical protein
MKNLSLLALCAVILYGFSSCDPVEPTTYDIPTTYNFENVSYSGQTNRLDMMEEITTYLKTAHVAGGPALDAAKIKDMYDANTGNHFSTTDLNSSTKKLKNKTVSSMQSSFEGYMDAVATASLSTDSSAANGRAGIITKNDNSGSYLLNANGVELTQIIEKGLMGACFYYQGTAVYMGSGKMDVDNETVVAGEGTEMEHHFDEGFGYFGVPTTFPSTTTGIRFWGKYCNKHEAVYPLNALMMDNFLKGRAAITNKDIPARDEAITELQKNWELVVAATSLYYLNITIDKMDLTSTSGDLASAHHAMSEAFAFIMSLKYGAGTGSITPANVDTILSDAFGSSDPLQANFHNVTTANLEAAKTAIVGYITDLASVKDTL